jgi:hypothetical protein
LTGKLRELANPVLGEGRAGRLEALATGLAESAFPEMELMFAAAVVHGRRHSVLRSHASALIHLKQNSAQYRLGQPVCEQF